MFPDYSTFYLEKFCLQLLYKEILKEILNSTLINIVGHDCLQLPWDTFTAGLEDVNLHGENAIDVLQFINNLSDQF